MNNHKNKYGIINFSNNCYLNVIIQLFLCNVNTAKIITNYLEIVDNNINPKILLKKLSHKIDISKQNDSQEVFTLILDLIPELEKFYENKIKNYYICKECSIPRTKEDTFSTFYIHKDSLEESLKDFIKDENFELLCDNCKKNTLTVKSCKIKKLGNILIFYNILKNKLKLTEYITFGEYKYKLTGIIKHIGTLNFGHYIFIDYINKLKIDDTNIEEIHNFTNDDIYLVFYTF